MKWLHWSAATGRKCRY